jgi:hypothetical protein
VYRVHYDNVSLGGNRYFVSFIDDYTRQTWIYLIKRKSGVFDCFWDQKGFVQNESGRKIRCLRSDGGKEYFSGQFNCYLRQMGIRREFSCRYTLEQSGVAERKNRSIVDAAWVMLEEKSLPKFYWAEAVRTAVYIQNRIGDRVSAHERYFETKPDLRHLRVFGSIAYVHIPKEKTEEAGCESRKVHLSRLFG